MARKQKTKKVDVKVWLPEMIPAALIRELPGNSQKQNKHEFAELRKSIREQGFDESLLVVPEDDHYVVVSGNHRFRAGKAEGMTEFPCVIRPDWNEVQRTIQSVRRNYVRGKIDKDAFTEQVNQLASEHSLTLDVIYEQMGFENTDEFAKLYQKEREREKQVLEEASVSAAAVRILDDLGNVVSTLLAEHGHTVPHSFIIFPTGGKNHLYIASTPVLRQTLEMIVEYCVSQGIDINVALGGLLQIGISNSSFLTSSSEEVVEKGSSTEGGADADLSLVAPKNNG